MILLRNVGRNLYLVWGNRQIIVKNKFPLFYLVTLVEIISNTFS